MGVGLTAILPVPSRVNILYIYIVVLCWNTQRCVCGLSL